MPVSALIVQTTSLSHLAILFVSDEILSREKHCLLVPTDDTV